MNLYVVNLIFSQRKRKKVLEKEEFRKLLKTFIKDFQKTEQLEYAKDKKIELLKKLIENIHDRVLSWKSSSDAHRYFLGYSNLKIIAHLIRLIDQIYDPFLHIQLMSKISRIKAHINNK
jgi:hypothetical protein